MYTNQNGEANADKIIKHIIIVIVGLIVLFGSFGTVGAGERGVKTRFSAVVGTVEQGLYFKLPLIEKVRHYQ